MKYYTATAHRSAKMSVSYECENCGKPFAYEETFKFEAQSSGSLAKTKAQEEALRDVERQMAKERERRTTSKDFGWAPCPACGYVQSWMEAPCIAHRIRIPVVATTWITTCLIFAAIGTFIYSTDTVARVAVSASPVLVFFVFMVIIKPRLVERAKPNAGFGSIERRNTPIVKWNEEVLSGGRSD